MDASFKDLQSDNNPDSVPRLISDEAKLVSDNLLPEKSREKYEKCYEELEKWHKYQKTTSFSEDVMLVHFSQIAKHYKPTTAWSKYSMLKSMLSVKHRVDLSRYRRLIAFLAKNGKTYKSKKSKILEPIHIETFLTEAPDNPYLAIKVALILGIAGACRREELINISFKDIEHRMDIAIIKIPHTKNNVPRRFTIDGDFYDIFKKYEAMRPENPGTDRFFLSMRDGKCSKQVIGINTFGAMPKLIAEYLHLEEPQNYTGHSFRRASATMLANAEADSLTLKRHGGWKSDQVAMGYIEDSITNKKKICRQISGFVNLNRPVENSINSGLALSEGKYENADNEDFAPWTSKDSEASTSRNSNASTSRNSQASTSRDCAESSSRDFDNAIIDKENSSKSSNKMLDIQHSIQLSNCQVTFNYGKQ